MMTTDPIAVETVNTTIGDGQEVAEESNQITYTSEANLIKGIRSDIFQGVNRSRHTGQQVVDS